MDIDIEEFLKKTNLFKDFSENSIKEITHTSFYKKLLKDELLTRENTYDLYVYLIVKGKFGICKSSHIHNKKIVTQVAMLDSGDVAGELSFLDEQPRSADVIALQDDCAVIAIPYNVLNKSAPASFYHQLARKLSANVRKSNEAIIAKLEDELEQSKKISAMGRLLTYTLLLTSLYILALKGLSSLGTAAANMTANIAVISLFTFVLTHMVYRMGYSFRSFGLNLNNWRISLKESLFATFIFLIFLTVIKVLFTHGFTYHYISKINLKAMHNNLSLIQWPALIFSMIIYAIFASLQEFISRGVLQSSLQNFLTVTNKKVIANIVTTGIFASMHVHLSAAFALAMIIPSLLWGWLYSRQPTLLGPIVSHIIIGWWGLNVLGFQVFFSNI